MANLTDEQVVRIRELAAKGKSDEQIATLYKKHKVTISNIRLGHQHADVGGPITRKRARSEPGAATISVPGRKRAAKKPGRKPKAGRKPRNGTAALSGLETRLRHLMEAWDEIHAAYAIMGQRIKDIEEILHG